MLVCVNVDDFIDITDIKDYKEFSDGQIRFYNDTMYLIIC